MIIRLLLATVVVAGPVLAQDGDMHVLVVTGLSGEPYFAASFANTAEAIVETAGTTWGIPSDRITWLAERQEGMATGRATKASLDSAFASLLSTSRPGDVVFVSLSDTAVAEASSQNCHCRVQTPLWSTMPVGSIVSMIELWS
jgi:hypothetical protein